MSWQLVAFGAAQSGDTSGSWETALIVCSIPVVFWSLVRVVVWLDRFLAFEDGADPVEGLERIGSTPDHGLSRIRVTTSEEAIAFIRAAGGMLFVWPETTRSPRLVLTRLKASCRPPRSALDYRRRDADGFLLFLHPAMRVPIELKIELRGHRHVRIEVFWNGLAYAD